MNNEDQLHKRRIFRRQRANRRRNRRRGVAIQHYEKLTEENMSKRKLRRADILL